MISRTGALVRRHGHYLHNYCEDALFFQNLSCLGVGAREQV